MIETYALKNYGKMFREPEGQLRHKFIVPGSIHDGAIVEQDLENSGEIHEYYDPESGEPARNPGFQNWNLLSINMKAWLNGEPVVEEF